MSIAIYIRLSEADRDKNEIKTESDSIINQRSYIHEYIDKQSNLKDLSRYEFIDDGFSGTNDNRPQFNRMIEMVKKQQVKIICVKDFSRFFRDYIEAGNYLECVFPYLGVRFISINDNYDSDNYKGTTGGLEMVMRNIIYTAYSKDLSNKVVSAKINLMKQGKYLGGNAPFGYERDTEDKQKLVIDTEASKIVRMIFELAIEGKTISEIVRLLNLNNIVTRAQYYKQKNPNSKKYQLTPENSVWSKEKVHDILKNKFYTGDLICHRKKKVSFNSKKVIRQDPIVVPDNHTPIVSKDEFNSAQKVIRKLDIRKKKTFNKYPLKGVVRCGHCHYALSRERRKNDKYVYICKRQRNVDEGQRHFINYLDEKSLEKQVYDVIKNMMNLVELQHIDKKEENSLSTVLTLSKIEREIESIKLGKLRLYEKYTLEEINKSDYISQKQMIEETLKELITHRNELQELRNKEVVVQKQEPIKELCERFFSEPSLTIEMVNAFIKSVFIYEDNKVEVVLKFNDVFQE